MVRLYPLPVVVNVSPLSLEGFLTLFPWANGGLSSQQPTSWVMVPTGQSPLGWNYDIQRNRGREDARMLALTFPATWESSSRAGRKNCTNRDGMISSELLDPALPKATVIPETPLTLFSKLVNWLLWNFVLVALLSLGSSSDLPTSLTDFFKLYFFHRLYYRSCAIPCLNRLRRKREVNRTEALWVNPD